MSSTGATLSGSFTGATGAISETGFWYGTSSANLQTNGTQVNNTGLNNTNASGDFTKGITGLSPNTTYWYLAYVKEYNASTSSAEPRVAATAQSFKTKAIATATTTVSAASNVAQTSVTLNGGQSGATGALSAYGFYYGTSTNAITTRVVTNSAPSASFSYNLSGLSANTTYYYKSFVVEYNENAGSTEERVSASYQSFTTQSASQPQPSSLPGHLGCYEIPAVTNVAYSGTGAEVLGNTNWYRYNTGNDNQKIVTHTFKNDQVSPNRVMRSYTLLQDFDKKCALWVACAMNGDDYPSIVSRTDKWAYDPALPDSWQPNLSSSYPDKNGQSYDRGHQLASSYRRTTTYQAQMTCYFTNMTPQLAALNQGVWQSTIESNICEAGLATKGRDTLYVISGPLFQSGYGTVEDKDGVSCAKPTHYYQCFMRVSFNNSGVPQSAIGAAYLVEHVASPTIQYVTIDYVESLAGFDFFANVPTSIQNNAEATATPISTFKSASNIASVGDNNWGSL